MQFLSKFLLCPYVNLHISQLLFTRVTFEHNIPVKYMYFKDVKKIKRTKIQYL